MLEEIGDVKNVPKFLEKAKDKDDPTRLMGFGHRVYKNYDPRAKIIREICHQVLGGPGGHRQPAVRAGAASWRRSRSRTTTSSSASSTRTWTSTPASSTRRSASRAQHVHRDVRHRAHRRLGRPLAGDDRGPAITHRPAAADLHGADAAGLRRDREARVGIAVSPDSLRSAARPPGPRRGGSGICGRDRREHVPVGFVRDVHVADDPAHRSRIHRVAGVTLTG